MSVLSDEFMEEVLSEVESKKDSERRREVTVDE